MVRDLYQSSLANLEQLRSAAAEDRNEDTTRFQLIDPLLTECLAHPRSSIKTEMYVNPGYADYVIGAPFPQLIIEAKREGSTFELPAGLSGRSTVSLPTLRTDPTAAAAIDQVTRYANSLGVALAGIANGTQLAIFLATRGDGRPPAEGEAIVFTSLDEMKTEFRKLWDMLSRDGLARRSAQQVLLMGSAAAQPPPKLSTDIRDYPGFRRRSERETDLKLLSTVFIQDIEGSSEVSDEFLRECYYNSGTLSQYAFVSKEILRSRYENLPAALGIESESVQSKKGLNPALTRDLVSTAMNSKPIVLLGDVGVGKTMFIRHLLRVDAAEELADALVLYVDFGSEPALATHLQDHITESVIEQLVDDYDVDIHADSFVRAVYNGELNRFRRGIYGSLAESDPPAYKQHEIDELARLISNRGQHLERSLKHLEGSNRRKAVIVLDNIDQRPLDFQDQIFVIAQAMSARLAATVFVSLRPATFFESKLRGSLAAYQPRAFHVLPARVSSVVERRLAFARTKLNDPTTPTALSVSAADLSTYLDALERGFTSNPTLMEALENMSGGNTRIALEYLASFIGSGYVDTARILEVAERGDIYVIPVHEFMRSIIYGENDLYDPSSSRIANIFDISVADEREHFLLPLLLAEIQHAGEASRSGGFVEQNAIYEAAAKWGFSPDQTKWQLDRAVDKRLLDLNPGTGAQPYRITSVGAYMHRAMLVTFSYVDAMIVDTPVLDPSIRSEISDVRSISDRLDRADVFCDYLESAWVSFVNPSALPFDWNERGLRLRRDISEARTRADRAKSSRSRS